ncbi:telomere repeats-binding bouquet formation protein 2 [Odontesthes bonariensis]|uniref:telomere repeats-binding bouquet formation protein 2 n=1 Tax=Odontesthes bonariensis TaxID=219752 RepID=UPI003F58DDA2
MFRYKTAWFSSSVPQAQLNFWILEAGAIMSWRTADYLFSEDATCPDTLRIFESQDYLGNKVTVFHSLFLSACAKRQSEKSVCIGHYVLPPACVQDEVRKVVGRLIWEREDEQSVAQGEPKSLMCLTEDEHSDEGDSRSVYGPSITSESERSLCDHLRCPASDVLTGYVNAGDLQKYSGDLCDFFPGQFRCSKCKAHLCLTHT